MSNITDSKTVGLKSFKAAKKPRLTTATKVMRLAFVKRHHRCTLVQLDSVMCSDESTFQHFVARKKHVCRPPGKRWGEKYKISKVKHLPRQMI